MNKPSNCQCGGKGYRDKGEKWRVIQRRKFPATSRLKCLKCGWKWWSGCKYVSKLEDHVERSRNGMTDDHILQRLRDKTLIVKLDGSAVYSCYPFCDKRQLKIKTRKVNGSSYKFVKVCYKGMQKKIALHRLVWMSANNRTVPDGYDIDHVKGKNIEHPNGIENLRLRPSSENRADTKKPAWGQHELF